MQRKGVILVADGLGDRPVAALGGATPLEAAATPNMDRLATGGCCGLVDLLYPGMPVDTHTGAGILLGLKTRDALHLERGPVEAAACGLPLMPGEIALRGNLATLQDNGRQLLVLDRRAGHCEAAAELLAVLQDIPMADGFTAAIRPAGGHRFVMRLAGTDPLPAISDTDPGPGTEPGPLLRSESLEAGNPAGEQAAHVINRFCRDAFERLAAHPLNDTRRKQGLPAANGVITRGAGPGRASASLVTHLGLRAAVVSGDRMLAGLAALFEFSAIQRPEFTALPDTGLAAKISATLAALEDHDLVFLHIRAPLVLSRERDPLGKKEFLERLDAALVPLFREEIVIGVTAGTGADSNTGRHGGDPAPALLYSTTARRDECREFAEVRCPGGALGRIPGSAFLLSVLAEMDRLPAYRTSDSSWFL